MAKFKQPAHEVILDRLEEITDNLLATKVPSPLVTRAFEESTRTTYELGRSTLRGIAGTLIGVLSGMIIPKDAYSEVVRRLELLNLEQMLSDYAFRDAMILIRDLKAADEASPQT
ncbi:MAG: hypothetical protein Q8R07_04545 [Candidatus Uhrbacteria bacterium]|nr:hypothetical protein [Candidatus Uhrbacteria bacterium]